MIRYFTLAATHLQKFSLNFESIFQSYSIGLRKLRSLHTTIAFHPTLLRHGRVFGKLRAAPFLLPLSPMPCQIRQTTCTRLYGLRKDPPESSAKRRQRVLRPGK